MHHGEDLLDAEWLREYRLPELPKGLWVGAVMGMRSVFLSCPIILEYCGFVSLV
jgi:hypothetical protein